MNCNCGISTVFCTSIGTSTTWQRTATGEPRANIEQSGQWGSASAARRGSRRQAMNCNCGDSTVFCTIERSTCRSTTTGHVKNLVQELHRERERMHCGYLSLRRNLECQASVDEMNLRHDHRDVHNLEERRLRRSRFFLFLLLSESHAPRPLEPKEWRGRNRGPRTTVPTSAPPPPSPAPSASSPLPPPPSSSVQHRGRT